MRREPYDIGSIVHVLKRGARGMNITTDVSDQARFMKLLYYLNDEYKDELWEDAIKHLPLFGRPNSWPTRKPIVNIYAWVLMPNHFHLILEEIQDDGISKFMQKICGSMTMHFNAKYEEKGSIFQGPYKSLTVDTDRYFIYLAPYVMVKNVFELYPGGLKAASKEFERAWKWASEEYKYSSLPEYAGTRTSPILAKDAFEMFDSRRQFKALARDMILGREDSYIKEKAFDEL